MLLDPTFKKWLNDWLYNNPFVADPFMGPGGSKRS